MIKLRPCPFCGWNDGAHRKDCYMLLLGRNIDAVIEGEEPPISVGMLDEAWNKRYEQTCTNIAPEKSYTPVFDCSECRWDNLLCMSDLKSDEINYCPKCGRKVIT